MPYNTLDAENWSPKEVIVVTGVTGSGKSRAVIESARFLKSEKKITAEVVNADSLQLYGELKLLTAFPLEVDLNITPHHLFGILNPNEKSSAAMWREAALKKIDEIRERGNLVIICGGTGFYINALLNGISEIPEIPTDFRRGVFDKFQTLGREKFFDALSQLDPELCSTLHMNNTQRVLRAYEVAKFTGTPLSRWWKNKTPLPHQSRVFCLLPSRDILRQRCETRLKNILKNGLLEEVKSFSDKYPFYDGPLTKALGYKEALKLLSGELDQDKFLELTLTQTMQYAKRQSTWFRHQLPPFAKFIRDESKSETRP